MKLRLLAIAILLFIAPSVYSRAPVNGIVQRGGKTITTSGAVSTTKSVQTYPGALVTVLQADGSTNATIYSTSTGTALGNPMTSGSDASYSFYLDNSLYYLRYSGTGITTPWTVGPFVASDPSDVYNVLGFGAVCNGSTADTVAISAANTAAVAGGGSLYIPPSTGGCKIGTATLTAPIRSDGGSLLLTTGQTTTITSSLTVPPQIFFRGATAGLGTVSFSGNTVQKDFWVAWWGADSAASGAATSAALNAAFVAWPNDTTMHLSNRTYSHTGLTVDHKFQVTLVGNDSIAGYSDTGTSPKFVYVGTNGGTAWTLSNVYASTFRGFVSYGAASSGATGAAKNIYCTFTASGFPALSSRNVFSSLLLVANNTRSDYRAIDISNANGANNEHHNLYWVAMVGGSPVFGSETGTGVYLGHANVKQIGIEHCYFDGLATAIESASGSFRGFKNFFNACAAIYSGQFSDAISVVGDDSESCTQVLQTGVSGNNVPFTIIGGRYDSLHGAGVASATRTTDPILNYDSRLTVIGTYFGAADADNFTDQFISGLSNGGSPNGFLVWENSQAAGLSPNFPISKLAFNTGLSTFRQSNVDSRQIGGTDGHPQVLQGGMSSPMASTLIGIQLDDDGRDLSSPAAKDSLVIGDAGQIEVAGIVQPTSPAVSYVGANDSGLSLIIAVLARDALGNRTYPSILNQQVSGNSTLSGSNYIVATWPKVPNATDYILLQFSGGVWRTIGSPVTASGTNTETVNIQANPSGAFSYTLPTFNETVANKLRGSTVMPVERAFTSLDATPSVVGSSDFVTANAGATSIATFDDGILGQVIRIRINDANTTLVNGSGLLNRTGANIVATNGLIYTYIRRGSAWYQL